MKKETTNTEINPDATNGRVQRLVSPHFTQGGTGVTNFSPSEESGYAEAIEKFGSENLIISHAPMSGNRYALPTDYSLHNLSRTADLSSFWRVFDKIQEANVKLNRR